MKLEDKVISLETAKRLAELCKEKGVTLMESEYEWVDFTNNAVTCGQHECGCQRGDYHSKRMKSIEVTEEYAEWKTKTYIEIHGTIPAYDVAELGEILPEWWYSNKGDGGWWVSEQERIESGYGIGIDGKTEAEARGKCLIYLLENDLFPTTK